MEIKLEPFTYKPDFSVLPLSFKLYFMMTHHIHPLYLLEQHPIILTSWCNAEMAWQRGTAHHQLGDDAGEGREAFIKC